MNGLSLVFAGSPAAAVPSLQLLAASGHQISTVLTREDSPQGRKRVLTPTAVGLAAAELGLPTLKANRLAGVATDQLTALQPDLGVIVAYGGLVREPLLSMPRLGWINLHFSLLPRWRGAAPVQRAIMAGDEITGAAVFQLVPELDAGDIFGLLTQQIDATQNAGQLLHSLALSGAELLLRVVDNLADGTARADPQVGDVTLAPKLSLDDGRVDFAQHASTIVNLIRGVTPEPGAFATLEGLRFKILEAERVMDAPAQQPGTLLFVDGRVLAGTGSTPVQLVTVHPAGKKPMRAADWWRGRAATASTTFDGVNNV